MPHFASSIKQVQANQLSSIPPLKPLWFSNDYRSQIIHPNAPISESTVTHQGWTMKTCSTVFLVIAIMIILLSNKCTTKTVYYGRKSWWCTSSTKSVPQDFSWIGTYKLIYYMAWKLSPDQVWLFHKNPSCYNNFRILLVTKTKFWILLCYLLNMLPVCIGSISWCCFVVTLFRCFSHVPLFCGIPIVLPVFSCMFCQCSGVPCSIVPCSGVPGFIVYPLFYICAPKISIWSTVPQI